MQILLLKFSKRKQNRVSDDTLFFASETFLFSFSVWGITAFFLPPCPAHRKNPSLFFSKRGITSFFSSPMPLSPENPSLFFSKRGITVFFLPPYPAQTKSSSLFSSKRGITSFFLPLCPAHRKILLFSSDNQDPVTGLDLIPGHTIGLPEGCHRHVIPLSDIPQAVTLPHYINSQ